MEMTTGSNFGYASFYSLLMGWSKEYDCAKIGPNNKLAFYLKYIYKQYSSLLNHANYYMIDMDRFYSQWGSIVVKQMPNPIKTIYIVELDDIPNDVYSLFNDGVEYIDGDIVYVMYKSVSEKGFMDDDAFSILIEDILSNIQEIVSLDRISTVSNEGKSITEYTFYDLYKMICPIYYVFKWIYDLDSNITFELWENIIYNNIIINYLANSNIAVNTSKSPIIRDALEDKIDYVIYDLLIYMSKNNFINVDDIIKAIIESDFIKCFSDWELYIRSSSLFDSDSDFEEMIAKPIHYMELKKSPKEDSEANVSNEQSESNRSNTDN